MTLTRHHSRRSMVRPTWTHTESWIAQLLTRWCRTFKSFPGLLSSCRVFSSSSGPSLSGVSVGPTRENTLGSVQRREEGREMWQDFSMIKKNPQKQIKPQAWVDISPSAEGFLMIVSSTPEGIGWRHTRQPRSWRTNHDKQTWGKSSNWDEGLRKPQCGH